MVEYRLAKARVAGSNPVSRFMVSIIALAVIEIFFYKFDGAGKRQEEK